MKAQPNPSFFILSLHTVYVRVRAGSSPSSFGKRSIRLNSDLSDITTLDIQNKVIIFSNARAGIFSIDYTPTKNGVIYLTAHRTSAGRLVLSLVDVDNNIRLSELSSDVVANATLTGNSIVSKDVTYRLATSNSDGYATIGLFIPFAK